MEINNKDNKIKNIREDNSKTNNKNDKKTKKEKKYKLNGLTTNELLKIVKQTNDFPKHLSKNIPLNILLDFYDRLWNGDTSDEDSGASSSI